MAAGELRPPSRRERKRLAAAVDAAEETTGLQIAVYLGTVPSEDTRAAAEALFVQGGLDQRPGLLVLVDPPHHRVEVLTGPEVRHRVADEDCDLAVAAMTERFRQGDLAGGLEAGLAALVEAAGPGTAAAGTSELPDLLD